MMNGSFIRCVLMALTVFAVLQDILIVGAYGDVTDECHTELSVCIFRALLPYAGLTNEQTLAKARTTPLAIHCTDWSVAMTCDRRQLRSEVCRNVTSVATDKVIQVIKVIDLVVNYTCKQNFLRINRIYRCVLDQDVFTNITEQCKGVEFNATNVCEKIPVLIKCAAKALTSRCGPDAGNIVRELGPKVLKALAETTYDRKCSPSKRVESDDLTAVLKRVFYRK